MPLRNNVRLSTKAASWISMPLDLLEHQTQHSVVVAGHPLFQ
ncbi:hypothetical protein ACLIN6_003431 [Vibrio cholerae]